MCGLLGDLRRNILLVSLVQQWEYPFLEVSACIYHYFVWLHKESTPSWRSHHTYTISYYGPPMRVVPSWRSHHVYTPGFCSATNKHSFLEVSVSIYSSFLWLHNENTHYWRSQHLYIIVFYSLTRSILLLKDIYMYVPLVAMVQ